MEVFNSLRAIPTIQSVPERKKNPDTDPLSFTYFHLYSLIVAVNSNDNYSIYVHRAEGWVSEEARKHTWLQMLEQDGYEISLETMQKIIAKVRTPSQQE